MFIKDGKVAVPGISEKYIPNLENFDDRTDPKWAHPELTMVYDSNGTDAMNGTSLMNDPILSRKERIKTRDAVEEKLYELFLKGGPAASDNMVRDKYTISGLNEGDPDVEIFITKPKNTKKKALPSLFVFGQGACYLNGYGGYSSFYEPITESLDVALVFVAARTAADAYFPAPLDDYQVGYQWLLDNGESKGLDPDNIVLMGGSGGGYAALCFAFRCKRVGFKPRGCMAEAPIIDDRMSYPSSRIVTGGWDAIDVLRSFKSIIKDADQFSPFQGPEVVPGHATVEDCKGLCPVYVHALELDAGRDSATALVGKLQQAKVFTQLHIWGGAMHGAFTFPVPVEKSYIKEARETVMTAELHDMFEYDLRRQWLNEEK